VMDFPDRLDRQYAVGRGYFPGDGIDAGKVAQITRDHRGIVGTIPKVGFLAKWESQLRMVLELFVQPSGSGFLGANA